MGRVAVVVLVDSFGGFGQAVASVATNFCFFRSLLHDLVVVEGPHDSRVTTSAADASVYNVRVFVHSFRVVSWLLNLQRFGVGTHG